MVRNKLSLRSKFLILFVGLVLMSVLTVGLYGHTFLSRTVEQQAIQFQQQILATQALQVYESIDQIRHDLTYLSEIRTLKTLANIAPDNAYFEPALQAFQRDLLVYASTHPMIHKVSYYDPLGQQVAIVESSNGNVRIQNTPTNASTSNIIRSLLNSPIGASLTVLSGENNDNSKNIVTGLHTGDGIVLIEAHTTWLFRLLPIHDLNEAWSLRLPTQETLHYAQNVDTIIPPTNSTEWQTDASGYYAGRDSLIFYQQIDDPFFDSEQVWILFHNIPQHMLLPDLSHYDQLYAVIATIVIASVIGLALFAVQRFIQPIHQLKSAIDVTRKTSKMPDLPSQLPPDEIGDLTLAFYTMAMELEERRRSERELVEKLITAQEEERKRIAYDLHDGLLQQLVGARFYLSQCKQQLVQSSEPNSTENFEHGFESLSSAIVEGRQIMEGLHPTVLDDLGLQTALSELAQNIAQIGKWQLNLSLNKLHQEPDRITAVSVYRIAQEALNNICKHASATHVSMTLHDKDGIHLVIVDDGIGFEPKSPPKPDNGWGIRTMTERVNLLDGEIQLSSTPDEGTTLSVWIPIPHRQESEPQ